jgi:lysophospholipase L1-like esterase
MPSLGLGLSTTRGTSPGVAFDPEVSAYAAQEGITDSATLRRINNAVVVLDNAGIRGNLIDAAFLRTGMVASATSPKTFRGLTGTTGGTPTLTSEGLDLVGATKWARCDLTTAPDAFTMVMDVQGVTSGQTASATIGGLINASGWTTPGGQLLNLSGGANTTAYVVSRQSPTTTTTNAMTDNGDARVVAFYNPLPQIVAFDYDDAASPTIKAAVDGLVVLTDSTGNTRSTSALDRVMIGARFQSGATYDTPYKGKHAAWLLFDKALNATEHAAAALAIRMLDPRRITFICQGDSLTAQFANLTVGLGNWPAWFIRRNTARNAAVRLINGARNGTTSVDGVTNFQDRAGRWFPDGKIATSGVYWLMYGTNDILSLGASAATIYGRIQTLMGLARAEYPGIVTGCMTVFAGRSGAYTAPQEAVRSALNDLIRAGDGVDFDLLLDTAEIDIIQDGIAQFFTDALHPNAEGNRIVAQRVAATIPFAGITIPRNTALPVVTGTLEDGETLSATNGTWENSPSGYTYQWMRNATDIGSATASTYLLTATDIGTRIACRVTATNASGDAEITSNFTSAINP